MAIGIDKLAKKRTKGRLDLTVRFDTASIEAMKLVVRTNREVKAIMRHNARLLSSLLKANLIIQPGKKHHGS